MTGELISLFELKVMTMKGGYGIASSLIYIDEMME